MKRFIKNLVKKWLPSIIEEYADEIVPHFISLLKSKIASKDKSKFFMFLMKEETKNTIEDIYKTYMKVHKDIYK